MVKTLYIVREYYELVTEDAYLTVSDERAKHLLNMDSHRELNDELGGLEFDVVDREFSEMDDYPSYEVRAHDHVLCPRCNRPLILLEDNHDVLYECKSCIAVFREDELV